MDYGQVASNNPQPSQGLERSLSRPDLKGQQIIVFVRSEDNIYLEDRQTVQGNCSSRTGLNITYQHSDANEENVPLGIFNLSRNIWQSEKIVFVPTANKGDANHAAQGKDCECCRYAATISVNRIAPYMIGKRALGLVRRIVVYENAIGKNTHPSSGTLATSRRGCRMK